jgi:hypothetical protein
LKNKLSDSEKEIKKLTKSLNDKVDIIYNNNDIIQNRNETIEVLEKQIEGLKKKISNFEAKKNILVPINGNISFFIIIF